MTASHSSELMALLDQEVIWSESLQQCLVEETSALMKQDLDQLNTLLGQKNQLLTQLQQAASKRQNWLHNNHYVSSDIAVVQLTQHIPELAERWSRLQQTTMSNQHQNQVNGEIILQNKSRNQQMLKIFGIQSRRSSVYTGKGNTADKGLGLSIAKA